MSAVQPQPAAARPNALRELRALLRGSEPSGTAAPLAREVEGKAVEPEAGRKRPSSIANAGHDGRRPMTTSVIPDEYRAADGRIDVERLKARIGLAELAGRLTDLRRAGSGRKGLCPFHDENTPSFFVDEAKGVWHCFGCGRGGDHISLLVEAGADGFVDACGRLADEAGVSVAPPATDRRRDAEARRSRVALARREWRAAVPVAGTPAEAYLAARGLAGNTPGSIRFGRTPATWDERTGAAGPRWPALIAAAQGVDGRITGIQRIFIDPARRGYPFRPLRLSLGRIRGSALRLGPAREEIMLTGSVEDGLALMRMFVGATVWVSLGEANLASVVMPPVVRSVVLFGDADEPGRAAVEQARLTLEARGLSITQLFPRHGKDANAEHIVRDG